MPAAKIPDPMRVLVVQDEPAVAATIERHLLAEHFDVDVATDGGIALCRAREGDYRAMILDVSLRCVSGHAVCKTLRKEGIGTPILMLTTKAGEHDEVEALELGADDFMRKPFSSRVLVARLRALLRRGQGHYASELALDWLRYNPTSRQCWVGDREVGLTGREAGVLETLLRARGEVVPKATLIKKVWGMDFDGDPNIADVYIGYLRRKIERPDGQRVLRTVRGVGYRLIGVTY